MKAAHSAPSKLSLQAPAAKMVFIAGTFNAWKPGATPLQKDSVSGKWIGPLQLPVARNEYRSVVERQWCCEVGCEHEYQQCAPNEFGTMNPVLEVS